MAVKLLAAAAVLVLQTQYQAHGLQLPQEPGKPLPEFNCYDKHVKCSDWAKDGECTDNPTWMRPNCMVSCGQCGSVGGTNDTSEQCATWAKDGECNINYTWMFFNCPKSCEHTGKKLGGGAYRSGSMSGTEL